MHTSRHTISRNPGQAFAGSNDSHTPQVIGIVVFDGFSMLPAAEVADVFDKANQVLAVGRGEVFYQTSFISLRGGCVSSSAQIDVLTHFPVLLNKARALFVAGGESVFNTAQDETFCRWLRETALDVDDVFAIGNGDLLLSAAGLACKKSHSREDVAVEDATRVIAHRNHAMHSGPRQALEMIRQDFGNSVLHRVLQLLPDTRFPELTAITHETGKSVRERILESAQWITRNCNKAISITVAAQTAGMSDRSYLRHFRAEMGVKPSEHLRRSRVELAAALLRSSDLPVDKIARRCGLTSGECLARLFRQVWDVSPTEYRNRVNATQPGV
ncbi:helix-turn-helix domain-containing protein [Paraburkholderia sp. C35]|uniref:helix-turn-helix domain-containing protein n=1 Tax=Paraburkholderia sp. C35 TaxID=2126993 RepID=UPI000D68D5A3|nr:helix-turn-helix domain-containing protein [Paraburkholderia sp. C35]